MAAKSIFWFRRDLRLRDNHGLFQALSASKAVIPIFIFDRNILDELDSSDPRVTFIHDELQRMNEEILENQSSLQVYYGDPIQIWSEIVKDHEIDAVYTNHDYEPYADTRDRAVEAILVEQNISFHTFKDHVIFERQEVLSKTGGVYSVFTPYKRRWLEKFNVEYVPILKKKKSLFPSETLLPNLVSLQNNGIISLEEMGFTRSKLEIPSRVVPRKVIKGYSENRNFPENESGTSRLGIHFRFGTISIREKALHALGLSEVYLSELIWRDFYAQILANYPHVATSAFRAKYEIIEWRNNEDEFEKWKEGKTGYPLVDAGMRELNTTGFMHNRVRMIVASFLTKHLLIDWRWGEGYFAQKLLDFDLASNNGGWQWASGSGTDAAPYFRIFNPMAQHKKFDPESVYVKRWVPEYGTSDYPEPIVDHKMARERCLTTYKEALARASS